MRNVRVIDIVTPMASGFTDRVGRTTTWVRSKPSWYIRLIALVLIILGAAVFFAVIIPLALVAVVVFILIDAVDRVRKMLVRLISRDAVPPDDRGRKNVRVRRPR